MKPEQLYKEACQKALRVLTYRGRSTAELAAYLARQGYEKEITNRVLEEMIRLRYLNDQRLAREIIVGRLQRGYGPVRIRGELSSKGFDKNLIESLLPVLYPREEEYFQAARWLQKKDKKEGKPENNRQIARWANFLRRRGFSEQTIAGAMREYM